MAKIGYKLDDQGFRGSGANVFRTTISDHFQGFVKKQN
jgi:hypothetical protein